MENYQGDLTDIVRASGGGGSSIPPNHDELISSGDWRFPSDLLMNYQSELEAATDDFGDPFSDMRDPLLHELHVGSSSSAHGGGGGSCGFFYNPQNSSTTTRVDDHDQEPSVFGLAQNTINLDNRDDDRTMNMIKSRPSSCNIFSRMLQISPNPKTTTTPNTTMAVSPCDSPVLQLQAPRGSIINANSLSRGCINDSTTGLQISSPRNPGIKRRKSQAKKVVCIPAPAPANSRPSGEIVPSDLWAWRKYGQKPIKGSPYPRGYYRCSSSKGCSARKQVERSRTDPNMLVITYTSEHNHPWPTQRNALAGSTRAQPSKNNNAASQSQKTANLNEEFKDSNKAVPSNVAGSSASVKEEMEDIDEKELDMDEGDQLFSEGFPPSTYKPTMPDSNLQPADQDFFADLDEIEANPLSLLLNQEFRSGDDDGQERQVKDLDPFSIFDCWPGRS